MLQLVEEAFDQIALSIESRIDRTLNLAVAAGWDVSAPATAFDQIDEGSGIVTTVLSEDWPCDSTIWTGMPA